MKTFIYKNERNQRLDDNTKKAKKLFRAGVYNLFAIAGRITFICMKYGRQWVRVIFTR